MCYADSQRDKSQDEPNQQHHQEEKIGTRCSDRPTWRLTCVYQADLEGKREQDCYQVHLSTYTQIHLPHQLSFPILLAGSVFEVTIIPLMD